MTRAIKGLSRRRFKGMLAHQPLPQQRHTLDKLKIILNSMIATMDLGAIELQPQQQSPILRTTLDFIFTTQMTTERIRSINLFRATCIQLKTRHIINNLTILMEAIDRNINHP
jgi:hypothetical protein